MTFVLVAVVACVSTMDSSPTSRSSNADVAKNADRAPGTPKGFEIIAQGERRFAAKPWVDDVHLNASPERATQISGAAHALSGLGLLAAASTQGFAAAPLTLGYDLSPRWGENEVAVAVAALRQANPNPMVDGFEIAADMSDVESLRKHLRTMERLAGNPKPSERVENDLAKGLAAVVKSHPDEPAVMFWLGDHMERQLKYDDALVVWQRSLSLPSVFPNAEADLVKAKACARISQSLLGKLDGDGAETFAKRTMELDPLNPAGATCLLESAFRTGRLTEAVAALHESAEKHGAKSPGLRVVYHDALARIGEWDRIKADLAELKKDDRRPEDYHHFQARIAEIDGRKLDAFLHHYLASIGGAESAATTARSRDYIEKIRFRDENELPKEIVPYAKALYQLDRADVNPDQRTAGITMPSADSEPAQLAGRYIQARCDAAAGKPGTIAHWRELFKDYPAFAPIYVGLAEAIEVESPESEEVRTLLAKAESLSPTNGIIREHFRMGARWKPTKSGAIAISVEPDTGWGRFPITVGDELVELDDKKLAEMPVHHRMAYVRSFVGGRVVYKPMGFSNTVERDLELTFFD